MSSNSPSGPRSVESTSKAVTHKAVTNKAANASVEVLYERSFILDLKQLPLVVRQQVQEFVFSDFFQTNHLQLLPDFRQMGNSGIFYRFTLAEHLISIEVTGQIIKFLRVLPKPEV
ncbi:cytotoxic translational repressor of toxin-antitoxin stability system [Alkalinema pantanalense CENA528]|uniref:cytotoxic translational repressor of toxin-antitoxin stability system n=1 Tax=Alkalinema pantanalense TaxID=1620705 RepID=UPI003D6E1922